MLADPYALSVLLCDGWGPRLSLLADQESSAKKASGSSALTNACRNIDLMSFSSTPTDRPNLKLPSPQGCRLTTSYGRYATLKLALFPMSSTPLPIRRLLLDYYPVYMK